MCVFFSVSVELVQCVCNSLSLSLQFQEGWECVSLELEQWVVCIKQLEDVLALQTLLCLPSPQGSTGGAVTRCSVKTLLESGRGA